MKYPLKSTAAAIVIAALFALSSCGDNKNRSGAGINPPSATETLAAKTTTLADSSIVTFADSSILTFVSAPDTPTPPQTAPAIGAQADDTSAPVVSRVEQFRANRPIEGVEKEGYHLTIHFDEEVTGLAAAGLTMSNLTLHEITPGAEVLTNHYRIDITLIDPNAGSVLKMNANAVTDNSTNTGPNAEVDLFRAAFIDDSRPSIAFHRVPANHNGIDPFTLTAVFSRGVWDFNDSERDLTLTNATATIAPSNSGGRTYNITLTPTVTAPDTPNTEAITLFINENASGNTTAGIGDSKPTNLISETITIPYAQPPEIIVHTEPLTATLTATTPTHNGDGDGYFYVTATFSRPVVRPLGDAVEISGGKFVSATPATGRNTVYRLGFQPDMDNENAISISLRGGVSDSQGNYSQASTPVSIEYNVPPTLTMVSGFDNPLTTSAAFSVTLTFSEAVSGLTADDFTTSGIDIDGITSTDTLQSTHTFIATPHRPIADGDVRTFALNANAVMDAGGGYNQQASQTYTTTYEAVIPDTTPPTLTMVGGFDNPLTTSIAFSVTLTFSEAVSGLTADDFTTSGIDIDGITSTDTLQSTHTFIATLHRPIANGDVRNFALKANAVMDAGGRFNQQASQTYTTTYEAPSDTTPPVVVGSSLIDSSTPLFANQRVLFRLNFNEQVRGLSEAGLTAVGLDVDSITPDATELTSGYSIAVTTSDGLTKGAEISLKVNAGVIRDASSNSTAEIDLGATTFDIRATVAAPTVVIKDEFGNAVITDHAAGNFTLEVTHQQQVRWNQDRNVRGEFSFSPSDGSVALGSLTRLSPDLVQSFSFHTTFFYPIVNTGIGAVTITVPDGFEQTRDLVAAQGFTITVPGPEIVAPTWVIKNHDGSADIPGHAADNFTLAVTYKFPVKPNPNQPAILFSPNDGSVSLAAERRVTADFTPSNALLTTFLYPITNTSDQEITITVPDGYEQTALGGAVPGFSVTVPTLVPTVMFSGQPPNHNGNDPFMVTATFSTEVTGFPEGIAANTDVVAGNASVVIAGSGAVYTLTVTPTPNTTSPITLLIPKGTATASAGVAAGVGNAASATLSIGYQPPPVGESAFRLHANGVTAIALPGTAIGTRGQINGVGRIYTLVDKTALQQIVLARGNLSDVITTGITDMSFLLDQVFTGNISHWDTSSVTNMESMLAVAGFNHSLEYWDVSQVQNMKNMFRGAKDYNQPMNTWDVGNVTNMEGMFYDTRAFNHPLIWNVSSVTNMREMFLQSGINQPLATWDVSSVADMTDMFKDTGYNQNLQDWAIGNVVMCEGFAEDVTTWGVAHQPRFTSNADCVDFRLHENGTTIVAKPSAVIDKPTAFQGRKYVLVNLDLIAANRARTGADLSSYVTTGITTMDKVFFNLPFNQDISSWDVSQVTNMSEMFSGNTTFNQDLSHWDVSNVTNMFQMFNLAAAFNGDISTWDVSGVGNMESMFNRAAAFNANIGNWQVSRVTDMEGMFAGATAFNQDIGNWDVGSVTNMFRMFQLAATFEQNLNRWPIGRVTVCTEFASGANENWSTANMPLFPRSLGCVLAQNGAIEPFTISGSLSALDRLQAGDVKTIMITFGTGIGGLVQGLTASDLIQVGLDTTKTIVTPAANVPTTSYTITIEPLATLNDGDPISLGVHAGGLTTIPPTEVPNSYINLGSTTFFAPTALQRDPFELHANTVTAIAKPGVPIGTTAQINGVGTTYIYVDEAMLRARVLKGLTLSNVITTGITDMSFLLDQVFIGNISHWDTSSVTNMESMLAVVGFNHTLEHWDVSQVQNMKNMFRGAVAYNQPMNDWDVSKVTDMEGMFYDNQAFNHPLSDWDVGNVTNMREMFFRSGINRPLTTWDVSRVTDMTDMFKKTRFNQELQGWAIGNVALCEGFSVEAVTWSPAHQPHFNSDADCVDFRLHENGVTIVAKLSAEINKPTAFQGQVYVLVDIDLLAANRARTGADLSQYVTTGITAMNSLFAPVNNFNQDISSWDVSSVTTMNQMFFGAVAFNQDISHWDVSQVTDMNRMFLNARVFNADINRWDVSSVTNMEGMFAGAWAFNRDLHNWDLRSVATTESMFNDARAFNGNIDNWVVGSVTDMEGMFAGAHAFNRDIGNWNVSNVANMFRIFDQALVFNQDLSRWSVGHITTPKHCGLFAGNTPIATWPESRRPPFPQSCL